MPFFTLITTGLILGTLHALDADHIVAVTTLLLQKHTPVKKATKLGFFWGIGHTVALMTIGLIVILLKITIPEKFGTPFDLMIGGMITILGIKILIQTFRKKEHIHTHAHQHGNLTHTHIHLAHAEEKQNHHRKPLTAFLIGTIHGMAGSAALMLIVLSTITNPLEGILYITLFGMGTILGMSIITTIIGWSLITATKKMINLQKPLYATISFTAIAFGIFFLHTILYT